MELQEKLLSIIKGRWWRLKDVLEELEMSGKSRNASTISMRLKSMAEKGLLESVVQGTSFLYAEKGTPSIQDDIYRARIIKVMSDGFRRTVKGISQKCYLSEEIVKRIMDTIDGFDIKVNGVGTVTYKMVQEIEPPDVPLLRRPELGAREKPKQVYCGDWAKLNAIFVEMAKRGFDRNPYEWMR